MAISTQMGSRDLPIYERVPEAGDVRTNVPTETGGCLSAGEFCRRLQKVGVSDKLRFYNIAEASLEECKYFLILARDLEYGDVTELQSRADQISRMLNGMKGIRRAR